MLYLQTVTDRPAVIVDPVTGEVRARGKEEDEDFFAKQAKLQDEARMALAQVRHTYITYTGVLVGYPVHR